MNDFSLCSLGVRAVMKTTSKFRMGETWARRKGSIHIFDITLAYLI